MELASNFCLLHAKLSKLGFSEWAAVNEGDVMTGDPHTFALFLRFLYQRFPAATAVLLRRYDWFLVESDDARLGATTIRVLAAATHATNLISATQFRQCKYAMHKINMCHALLQLLRSLTPVPSAALHSTRQLADREARGNAARTEAIAPPVSSRAKVNVEVRINERRRELNAVSRT